MVTQHHLANLDILNDSNTSKKLFFLIFPVSQKINIEGEEEIKIQIKFYCYRASDSVTMHNMHYIYGKKEKIYIHNSQIFIS